MIWLNIIQSNILTGDIIDGKATNKKAAYEIATNFFRTLIKQINRKFQSNISSTDFSFLPGNHDLERGNNDLFDNYKCFLNNFHGEPFFKENYNTEFLSTTRIFKEKKIVIIGLNSCMINPEEIDIDWIKNSTAVSDFIPQKSKTDFIERLIQEKQKDWDDFGKITLEQLVEVFSQVKSEINLQEYRVLTAFHHHINPFPEILGRSGDSSKIRNYYDVLNFFTENFVQLILHGHKHSPICGPITTNKYFENPESMMYVFSAGSSGDANKTGKSFQVLELHNKKSNYIAKLTKYDYDLEQLKKPLSELIIPPKQRTENTTLEILTTLEYENKTLFYSYREIEKKTIAQSYQVESIITNITNAITQFEEVRNKLKRNPELIYLFLLAIHYRIHKQHYSLEKQNNISDITIIEDKIKEVLNNDHLWDSLKKMLSQSKNDEFLSEYKRINDTYQQIDIKEKLSFITVATFFTDIFLTLGVFGEIYFENEGIDHKINITLPKDKSFRSDLELATLKMESDTERRCAKIKFKCSDPTIHKIAVLIIKDFEDKISNKKITLEEAFKNIGLCIYYIRPSIEKKYGLENLNFEAYIPTLLPLLTGENLYKNREVFIREMIQNSMDAILLRTQIEKARVSEKQNFDKTIYISFGENADVHGKIRKWVKIRDYGIGMDKFKIERYLTSIGRSFYVSKDFNKLQEKEKISYQPVSNFGIGFLSAFMVCKEISIITKSIESNETLKIEIPNYDGCFFLDEHRDSSFDYGTEITLYQDDAKPNAMNFEKIETYIKETIQDLQLDIQISKNNKSESISAFSFRKNNKKIPQVFVPFTENGIELLDYASCKKSNHIDFPYGFTILFEKKQINDEIIEFNEGIRLSKVSTENFFYKKGNDCTFIYNFPSSYIQLDVAREKINNFKFCKGKEFLDPIRLKNNLNQAIINQAPDLMKDLIKSKQTKLFTFDVIYRFCNENDLLIHDELTQYIFCLEFDAISQKISIVRQSDVKLMDENKIYINSQGGGASLKLQFYKKIN